MGNLIWIGAAISLIGLIGIFYCIAVAIKAKRADLSGDEMAARLQRLVVINMAALFLSVIGLMVVVTGVLLG